MFANERQFRYNNCDVEARVRSVILLLDLQSNNYLNEILPLLITHLIDYEKMITKSKPRHFANSLIHRVKQRVWQILLLLTHSYDQVGVIDDAFLNKITD